MHFTYRVEKGNAILYKEIGLRRKKKKKGD